MTPRGAIAAIGMANIAVAARQSNSYQRPTVDEKEALEKIGLAK